MSLSGGSGLIGGSTADVKVMEANRRISIVTVGVALDGLRGGWSGWEEVDVVWRAGVWSKIAYHWA